MSDGTSDGASHAPAAATKSEESSRPDRSRCPVCATAHPVAMLFQEETPVLQLELYPTRREAREGALGTLDLVVCLVCEFIWNRSFDPRKVAFGHRYESDQTHSDAFSSYVDAVVERVLSALPDRGHLLEIGCGQGYLLERVASRAGDRLEGATGFDPAWRGRRTIARTEIVPRAFDASSARDLLRVPDVVVARHVMQYVPEPMGFLRAIRAAMGGTGAAGRLFLETRDVEYSLRRGAVEDFCYETCSYFASDSLASALERCGFSVERIDRLFEDQYLLVEAAAVSEAPGRSPPIEPGGILELARRYAANAEALREALRERLRDARRRGKVAIWGAGTKGVALANLLDHGAEHLECLIDVNPNKQNRFLPRSCHPVVDPQAAVDRGVRTAFVANAVYEREITDLVAAKNLPIRVEVLPQSPIGTPSG